MRVYHDWEFLETGNSIYPISVGMVAEDGSALYYEFSNAPWTDVFKHEWLRENVVPHLTCTKDGSPVAGFGTPTFKGRLAIQDKVYNFLLNASSESPLELWGWYSAYDHVCLAQLFGRMLDLPDFVPMWTNDLRQEVHRLGNPTIPELRKPDEIVHHALDDAKAEMRMHEWLMNYEGQQSNG